MAEGCRVAKRLLGYAGLNPHQNPGLGSPFILWQVPRTRQICQQIIRKERKPRRIGRRRNPATARDIRASLPFGVSRRNDIVRESLWPGVHGVGLH